MVGFVAVLGHGGDSDGSVPSDLRSEAEDSVESDNTSGLKDFVLEIVPLEEAGETLSGSSAAGSDFGSEGSFGFTFLVRVTVFRGGLSGFESTSLVFFDCLFLHIDTSAALGSS